MLGPHGINGWKVQQKAHRYSITNLLQTILDRRPIAVSFLQQSADDGDGLMVQIKHHHREQQGGNHLHHHDHQHGGGQGGHHHHHDHCHEEGQGGPDVLEGQPPWANRSAGNQSRWRGPQRQRMGKRWQEMARDGVARRESTMITPGTPRATLRTPLSSRHLNSSKLLQTELESVSVFQSVVERSPGKKAGRQVQE